MQIAREPQPDPSPALHLPGQVFLLQAMAQASRTFSARPPSVPLLRRSSRMRWLSEPPARRRGRHKSKKLKLSFPKSSPASGTGEATYFTGDDLVSVVDEGSGQRSAVGQHLLLVGLELGRHGLFQGHSDTCRAEGAMHKEKKTNKQKNSLVLETDVPQTA